MSEAVLPIPIQVLAMSRSDDLNFLGQQAVADAMVADAEYRIVGGTMIRLLEVVYPTPQARARSTVDADAAVDDIEVIGPMVERLKAHHFTQERGNLFVKALDSERRIEVNLLLARRGPLSGMQGQDVPGVGQVDTLPELVFAMAQPALELDMTVTLTNQQVIEYTTRIPSLESAVVLKSHAWRGRMAQKDLVDLYSLLEIREAHPHVPWRLDAAPLRATRRDTAQILQVLRSRTLVRRSDRGGSGLPEGFDRLRMAALITRHIVDV